LTATPSTVIDFCQPVAGVVDHIDKFFAVVGFGEPVMKRDLRSEAAARQHLEHAAQVPRPRENVEVFRLAVDPRVVLERIGTADEVRHAAPVQHLERIPIQLRCVGRGEQRNIGVYHAISPCARLCRIHAVVTRT
jgi:hypothetical protein